MRHILAKRHIPILTAFATSNVLVAFDYDGTLAPISSNPDRAPMRARTRRLLSAVADRYPCIVISGRARSDLVKWLSGVPVWHLSGNHGLEPWAEDAGYIARVNRWERQLAHRLEQYPGVEIENKTYSLTVHYRHAQPRKPAMFAVQSALSALRGARLIRGKEAISVLPRDSVHKGDALQRARRLIHCDVAIYVGDDDTDEDAFNASSTGIVLGVRIGSRKTSKARYYLKDQVEIDALLHKLIKLRPLEDPSHQTRRSASSHRHH
jgi:trehalose 6-phosphate phosphatase